MARTQKHRGIAIGTPLGPDVLLLRSINGSEELSSLFLYSLDLLSTNHTIDFDAIVGQNVTVRIETGKGGTRYINGLVSSFAQSRRTGRLASYQATIVPWLWMLTCTSDCRMFQEQKVPDIIKEVMKDHGFSDVEDRLTGQYRTWEYCVQYNETDFHFVSRLMEQEGIYYFFKHENAKHTLVLCDAPTAHEPFEGYATVSYRPPEQATTDLEHVRDWRVRKQIQPGAHVMDDFNFKTPAQDLEAQAAKAGGHLGGDFEIYEYPGEYTTYGEGQDYAKLRMQEHTADREAAHGGGDVRGICTGCKFSLTDYARQDQNREYLVLSTTLGASSDEYDSGSGGGASFDCDFAVMDAKIPFRVGRVTSKPVIQGVQTALVVGPQGEEIYTDKYGRVKVQFHWDRRSKADETSSCWIRVTQTWAGKRWGAIHIPRIGQEVIVDFLEGDPDRPIITGTVYNGREVPPYTLPKEKTRSGKKSNSSKGGGGYNEVSMDDTKGKEQLRVHAEKDKDERVKNDSREWVGHERHLIVKKSQYERVEKHKHLYVEGDHVEEVKGDESLTIHGSKRVKIAGSHDERVETAYVLESGGFVQIDADTRMTLRVGPSVITLDTSGIYITAPVVHINSLSSSISLPYQGPDAAEEPDVAKKDKAGEVSEPPKKPKPPKPATYSSQAMVMQRAAASGAPFCEACEAARRAQQQQAATSGGGTQQQAPASGGGT